jgi:hypothetical protein
MKQLLLGGATLLALAASEPAARATLFDFTYSGSLVTFTVPTTDTYQILAVGAQGGSSGPFVGGGEIGVGGRGAEIGGDFSLTAGEILQIAVGGSGGGAVGGGGGGGGSFVVGPGNTPLIIGGGGGDGFGFGGGGGGYGGGGGGGCRGSLEGEGGGGSSFDAGTHQILVADFQTGNGEVVLCQEGARAPCCTRDEGGPFGAVL